MTSQKEINANRLNAKKSRGPITQAGKAISSRNAVKTGEYAKTEAARCVADIKTLTTEFNHHFNPTTLEQRFLVMVLIQSEYQTRRGSRLEAAIWENNRIEGGNEEENSIGAIYCRVSKELDFVGRHMDSAQKRFLTALKRLYALRDQNTKDRLAGAQPMPAQFPGLQQPVANRIGLFRVPPRA